MIEVTADTNIYISGLHFGGLPLQFLNLARARAFTLAISRPLRAEVRRVLCDKFRWSLDRADDALERLARFTTQVEPTELIDAVPDDPDDNRVLECAVAAGSGYIVTGDGDLLRLVTYSGIRILRVAEFLKLFPV